MRRHQTTTELLCLVCNENTGHKIDYLDENIKMITCCRCDLSYELIIEINFSDYPKELLHRLVTKPHRVLKETRSDLARFVHSFPLRIATKPYRFLTELIKEGSRINAVGRTINTDLFCSVCNRPTRHNLRYYQDVIHFSECAKCGLKMEFLSLLINYSNYPEELIHRVVTKPDRMIREISSKGPKFLCAIPVRVITKPYRACREAVDRFIDLHGEK